MTPLPPATRLRLLLTLSLMALTSIALEGADVALYGLVKTHQLVQSAPRPASPVSDPADPFLFEAFVYGSGDGQIDSVNLARPGGLPQSVPGDGFTFFIKSSFSGKPALDSAYPSGGYRLDIDSENDLITIVSLDLPADAYPPTPVLTNYAAAQAINASAPFTLRWESFTGAGPEDFIEVYIYDSIGLEVFIDNGTDGTAGSIELPAGTLQPSQTYELVLRFVNVTTMDFTSYPGAVGYVGYEKATRIPLVTTTGSVGSAKDVSFFAVLKWEHFSQTTSGPPVQQTPDFAEFSTILQGTSLGSITTASVTTPSSITLPLSPFEAEWSFDAAFPTRSQLDQAFPNGLYTLSISGVNDGTRSPILALFGDTYPTAPHLSNFDAAQAIQASSAFSLAWDPFVGGTTGDYVRVEVLDTNDNQVLQSGNPGEVSALNGTATSFTIPANTFQPGTPYTVMLLFAKATTDTTSYPGALGLSGYGRSTTIPVRTAGSAATAPTLSQPAIVAGPPARIQFTVNGTAGRSHRIEAASALGTWVPLDTITPTAASFLFTDTLQATPGQRFYRVVLLP